MSSARHSKAETRWGTEASIVEAARRTMGRIDFDPCSESLFNYTVGADSYYSLLERGENALELPWLGVRRLVNPPGGAVLAFWRRMLQQGQCRRVQSVWVGFSVEQLCLLAHEPDHPLDFSLCILRKRINFVRHDSYRGSPSHGNYVCGIGVSHSAFAREFARFGRVSAGRHVCVTS